MGRMITSEKWYGKNKRKAGIYWLADSVLRSEAKIHKNYVIASFGAGSGEKEKYLFNKLNRLNTKFYLFDRIAEELLRKDIINPSIITKNFNYCLQSMDARDSVNYLLSREIKADIILDIKGPLWYMLSVKRKRVRDKYGDFKNGKDGIITLLRAYLKLLKNEDSYLIIDCYRKEHGTLATLFVKPFITRGKYFGEVSTHHLIKKVVKQSPQRCYFTTSSAVSSLYNLSGICCIKKKDLRELLQTYTQGEHNSEFKIEYTGS